MSASPGIRGLRAAVFAAVCVLLAVGAHVLATGCAPGVGAQGVAFGAVFGAGFLLGGRERSLPGISAAMLAAQTALHLAFDATAATRATVTQSHRHGLAALPMHTGPLHTGPPHTVPLPTRLLPTSLLHTGLSPTGPLHPASLHMSSMRMPPHTTGAHTMAVHHTTPHALAAHLLAALLTSWWLRRGEAAVWAVLRRAVALLPGLFAWWAGAAPVPESAPGVRRWGHLRPPPHRLLLRHAVRRRGPPAPIPYAS